MNGAHARRVRGRTLAQRFWARVEKGADCWMWTGATTGGYGTIGVGLTSLRAHRVSWELHNGPVPDGMSVMHRCDTPGCVNPAHLALGTHLDNMRDMYSKGRRRAASGERNGHSRLTAEDVRRIRAGGESADTLAQQLGITRDYVIELRRGRGWAAVKGAA